MKKFLIIANWKLNTDKQFISIFLNALKVYLSHHSEKNIISLAPPCIYLDQIKSSINHKNIFLAAQNVDSNLKGAFTGEISVLMLRDIGVKYVILGHSERRIFHQENNLLIAKKFYLVKNYNLIPVLCIGENEQEKNFHQTYEVIKKQIDCIFHTCGKEAFRNVVIAYEPIWAIGTGKSANAKYAQTIHKFIKSYIFTHDPLSKNKLTVQYGGSVNSINAQKFLEQPDVDGLLIGNASLKYEEFIKIIQTSNNIRY